MSGDRYFINDQNATYFLTFTVVYWIDVFSRSNYKQAIVDSLNYCIKAKGLEVFAWVLMSNHLHLVACAKEGYRLSDIIRDFKKFTAKKIIQLIENEPESRRDWLLDKFEFAGKRLQRIENYKFWQDSNHAIEIKNEEMLRQKINYIHQNPVRATIVEETEYYLHSSARDYANKKSLVDISFGFCLQTQNSCVLVINEDD